MSDNNETDTNNCYECKNRKDIPGDCHSSCQKPFKDMVGHKQGIKYGWFMYPFNFDPIWKACICPNWEKLDA